MPTTMDQERFEHSFARFQILSETHDDLADDWRDQHIDEEAADAWGPSDLSANPLAEICRQLSTPGHYGVRPIVRHGANPEAADVMIGAEGALTMAGFWTKMQRVEYLTLGMGEMFMRLDVSARTRQLTARLVHPFNVFVGVDDEELDRAVLFWELRRRWWKVKKKWIHTWDQFDLGDETRPPSYRIVAAKNGTTLGTSGDEVDDVSNIFLRRPDGTFGPIEGDAYPFRYETGETFHPYSVYHAMDTGEFWNHLDRRGIHHGTLNTILYNSYTGHAARSAAGRSVIANDIQPVAQDVNRIDHSNVGSQGNVSTKGYNGMVILPGTIIWTRSVENGNPMIKEIGPAGELDSLSKFSREYAVQQAARWGLNPADVERQHANPSSGAALHISNKQKREAMRQSQPVRRKQDIEALRKAAAIMRIGGIGTPPETGYSLTYHTIAESPAEQKDGREQTDWELGHNFISLVEAYQELNVGTSREDALTAITRSKVDEAIIESKVSLALIAEGLDTGAGDPDEARPINELSLTIERLVRAGDLEGVNAIRRTIAQVLGIPPLNDLTTLPSRGPAARPPPGE